MKSRSAASHLANPSFFFEMAPPALVLLGGAVEHRPPLHESPVAVDDRRASMTVSLCTPARA